MPLSSKIVIADTSCFILLNKIQEIDLLQKLFEQVFTTQEVAKEFGVPLPSWIKIQSAKDAHYQQVLELEVDKGEASAIALGLEIDNSLLILDDQKARKVAEKLHLNYTGTLGIILRAKTSGVIVSVKPIVEKIKKTNFYFSTQVLDEIVKNAGE